VDGVHDVGGMQGFGAATWPGAEDPTHADWELRAFVLALVTGPGSSHAFRHTIERLDPVRYLSSTYYERWLYEAEQALVESGAITHDEVAAWEARLAAGEEPPRRAEPERAAGLVRALRRRRPLEPADEPRFAVGHRVRVRRQHPAGHTRCPRYLRGARGTILRYDGMAWAAVTPAVSTASLRGVWGSAANDVWVVGTEGTILHFDGTRWSPAAGADAGAGESSLNDVWGSAANDVYAVGTGGTILHFDGSAWAAQNSGTGTPLNGVWGAGQNDVWAVGENGTILRRLR